MKSKTNAIRKIIAMELPLLGILIQVAGYALIWFRYYYPLVRLRLKFYFNGHALVLVIYFILLLFFMATYGGFNAGYMKKADVILSQSFSLLAVNVISYLEDSLLRNWLLPAVPLLVLTAAQIAFAVVWVGFCDRAYKRAFPPLSLSLIHGSRDIKEIMRKFGTRPDKYVIARTIDISAGMEKVQEEILKDGRGVVNGIRIYMMPKIPDVLIKGSLQMHLFDTPLYMTREYALTFRQRFWKRVIDVVCSLLLLIITSPFFLITAIVIKAYDHGPVFYKQVRCTQGGREFRIIKFRSMKVDAEKDAADQYFKRRDVLHRSTPGAAGDYPAVCEGNAGICFPDESQGGACRLRAGLRQVQHDAL